MIDATKMQTDDLDALVTEMRIQANWQEEHGDIPQIYIEWQRSLATRLETFALSRKYLDSDPDFRPLEERLRSNNSDE